MQTLWAISAPTGWSTKSPGGQDWPRYCREYHSSDVELGALAKRVRPGMLFLDHIIRMGASEDLARF